MKIENVNIFNADGYFEKGSVCMENGFFVAGSEATEGPVIDGSGLYAIPGLTDLHFHGCVGYDFCDGTEEAIRAMAEYEASVGVMNICPATMTLPEDQLLRICDAAAAYRSEKGARLVGINMEGPFISVKKKGAQNEKYIRTPDVELYRRLQERSGRLFKLVDVAPETEGAMEFISQVSPEVTVSLAHTEADYDTAVEAFERGASHVTHLYNAMPPYSHRAPGVIGAAADNMAEVELICDGVHVHPSVVRNTLRMFGEDRVIFISDSMMATGMPDGEYALGGQAVHVKGNRATLADGTIAGSATNLMDCMRTAVKQMGVSLAVAVRCAAVNPAISLGIYNHYGSITPGKAADLILLDEDLEIRGLYMDGVKL